MQVGPYLIQDELARGGSGVVYRARDPASGQEVALKVLTGLSEAARRRALVEAGTLRRLEHPHLVRVWAAGEVRGAPWLAMELLSGGTLEARLARGPLAPREAAQVAHQVTLGLAHAHACGVLHRDVKPSNVLFAADGRAVLADFGLARDLDASRSGPTRTGAFLGTPGYWAPEQVAGDPARIGPAADVWGAGATLFALLVGRPPFLGASLIEAIHALEHAPAPRPSSLCPGLDPGLDAIVLRCLEKDPVRRYPGAEALARDLALWLRGVPPMALRAPSGPRAPRRWAVAGAGGVLLLAGLATWLALPGGAAAPASELAGEAEIAALLSQAGAREQQGDPEGALAAVDQALALDPSHPAVWGRRVGLLFSLGDIEGALAATDQGLRKIDPRSPEASGLTELRAMLGQLPPEKREELRAARVLGSVRQERARLAGIGSPGAPELRRRAALAARLGELSAARADLDAALRLDPRDVEALAARARLVLQEEGRAGPTPQARLTEREVAALRDAEEALALDPDHAGALVARGALREKEREQPGAGVADLERAGLLAPRDPELAYQLGKRLEDPRRQRELLERALRSDPLHLRARVALVAAHVADRDQLTAARQAREALAWIPAEHFQRESIRAYFQAMALAGALGR